MALTEAELKKIEEYQQKMLELQSQMESLNYSDHFEIGLLQKKIVEVGEICSLWLEYQKVRQSIDELKFVEDDDELQELVAAEKSELEKKLFTLETRLKTLLTPEDPEDNKNVFLEIRAGAGGDEACIFAGDLFRCYQRYADKRDWRFEIVDFHENPVGGFKEIVAFISGEKVYKRLKFEKGVHRVQRVPKTEASGRIHTSTVTVAVLPEIAEKEITIDPKDLKIETFRAGGAGGQYVNTTDSAVRITHIPSGIVVSIQDERSQHKNKEKALKVLRARLYEKQKQEKEIKLHEERKAQVGTGERAEKVRTYNFLQNRVTDHRVNVSWHNLDQILDGDLDPVIDELISKLSNK
ncbi:MAG: peptide chain release factor 1 [Deltaproteobacteria bacterium]|nr:peptide chain release factor 1 [Deltaproteobacteria bacterium]